jgi:hypothetical protein
MKIDQTGPKAEMINLAKFLPMRVFISGLKDITPPFLTENAYCMIQIRPITEFIMTG